MFSGKVALYKFVTASYNCALSPHLCSLSVIMVNVKNNYAILKVETSSMSTAKSAKHFNVTAYKRKILSFKLKVHLVENQIRPLSL